MTGHCDPSELRAALALGLSEMYAAEVPLYRTLLDTCAEMNAAHAAGGIDTGARVGKERHGAIRLGSMAELSATATLFELFGMHAVGLYDLRDTTTSSLPIVATAFRPLDTAALERSAFRMFTSVLVPGDRRFFDASTAAEIERRVAQRQLFPDGLADLIGACSRSGGVPVEIADRLVGLTVDALRLDETALDLDWHRRLADVSPVAADIAGAPSTHLNHLTPRVFDIDATHRRLASDGVEMIEKIQGPPAWPGPPLLLRQTSFRALDEPRRVIDGAGREHVEKVRVRFGEIEQRGVAPTRVGRAMIDRLLATGAPFESEMPIELCDLARGGLVNVRFSAVGAGPVVLDDVWSAVESGSVRLDPITYEDFLPASATGIFESNLAHSGSRVDDDGVGGAENALADVVAAVGIVHDPHELAAAEHAASLATLSSAPTS